MTMETKQLHALSKIYQEAVYGGAKKEAPKDTRLVVTAADKKANTPAYKNYKAGHKGYKAADHLKDDKQWGYDKDGNSLNPKDQKKNLKREGFSNWRKDLKEIPDYDQIPVDAKKRNEKISEKNVKNTVKINPEMKEETQVDEGVYEKQKTKEVMGALKKRDLKTDVKKKIAADIVKRKGDTSKSDDRYAYESKLWDEVAENLTELGELGGVKYKVVPLDESDIADILARLEKKRISKGGNPDESPLGKKVGQAMKSQQDKARKKAGVSEGVLGTKAKGILGKEVKELEKATYTMKDTPVVKADKTDTPNYKGNKFGVKEGDDWIQKAVKRPGAFTRKAKAAGQTVQQFAKTVDDNPSKYSTRTKRQANLAQTFASMKKEDVEELFYTLIAD